MMEMGYIWIGDLHLARLPRTVHIVPHSRTDIATGKIKSVDLVFGKTERNKVER